MTTSHTHTAEGLAAKCKTLIGELLHETNQAAMDYCSDDRARQHDAKEHEKLATVAEDALLQTIDRLAALATPISAPAASQAAETSQRVEEGDGALPVVAWLLSGGRVWADGVCLAEASADHAILKRADGSNKTGLVRLSDAQARIDALESTCENQFQHGLAAQSEINALKTALEEEKRQLAGAQQREWSWKKMAEQMEKKRDVLKAARIGYASEFPLDADGLPDVGNIHANIRALKAERDAAREKLSSFKASIAPRSGEQAGRQALTEIGVVCVDGSVDYTVDPASLPVGTSVCIPASDTSADGQEGASHG